MTGGAGLGPHGTLPPFARRTLGLLSPRRFEYDRLVRVRVGERRYLLTSPDDVRHVLVTAAANYLKTPRLASPAGRRRAGQGLLTSAGDAHRDRRRLLQPLFHRAAVERFEVAIRGRIDAWLDRRSPGETLDLAAEMADLTRSAILAVLFGDDLDPAEDARLARAIAARRRYTELVYHGRWPLRERLPTPTVRAHRQAIAEIDEAIYGAIRRRRDGHDGDDLIAALLRARAPDGVALTDRDVRDEALTFTSTGYETLGEALTWAWSLLARHPAIETELHRSVDEALAGRAPVAADVSRLGFAERVLDETLRLYPPTWIYARVPLADDRLPSGATARAGSTLYICPWILHRHPAHFPDPERFDPDRFAEGRRPPRFAYLPFGDGPHKCLGEHLARLEGVLALARIAQRVRFRPLDPRPPAPYGGITLRPDGGLPVRVEART
jgi:cytochrome P450